MKQEKGFTLIETIVAVMIMVMITSAVYTVYNVWYQGFVEENSKMILQKVARELMENIMEDLRKYSVKDTAVMTDPPYNRIDISPVLFYEFSESEGKLFKNTVSFLDNSEGTSVSEFTAVQRTIDEDRLIDISLTLILNKGNTHLTTTLKNTFRMKL